MTRKGYLQPGFQLDNDPRSRMMTSENYNLFLRLARIVRVDHENLTVDLVYSDSIGVEAKVPVTQGYAGFRSFLGAMPCIGDIVIVGYNKSGNLSVPLIVGFYPRGYASALNFDILGVTQNADNSLEKIRPKMRKIYDGEIFASSGTGSDILLDKDIQISNSTLTEILLKSVDQSIHMTGLNHYLNTTGVRVSSGLIHRNALLGDPEYRYPNVEFPVYYNSDSVPVYTPALTSTITNDHPYGKKTLNDDIPGFIEHRVEVKEHEFPIIPVTASNSGVDVDSLYGANVDGSSSKPMVVQVLGTLTGNDPFGEKNKYGMILKPKLFDDALSFRGKMSEIPCVASSGFNEATSLAAAYALKFPNTATAFYINKQGKYFANIGASTSIDPIGSGESAEVNLEGHTKIAMGKNLEKNRSLSMSTTGGVYTNWGFDNTKNRSWDATFRKAVSWNILGSDTDGNALNMRVQGDMRLDTEGSRFTEIRGNDVRMVHGVMEDKILGKKINQYVSDVNTTYGGKVVEMAIGHYNQTISSGISRTIVSPGIGGSTNAESTEIKTGNYLHKMYLGNKTEEVMLGNHDTKIGLGNRSVSIKAGNYSVKCNIGNIDIKTSLGTINVKTNGQVTIDGSLGVKIKSAVQVNVEAPLVNIGKMKPLQGIVTGGPKGHKDYMTGLPLVGAFTVKSSAM